MIVALEGLPGAGKTTLAGLLAEQLSATPLRETTAAHPFLTQVYDDEDRDDFTVELTFLVVHANPYRRIDRDAQTICDFSPGKDVLFAEDMLSGEDLSLFMRTYEHVYRDHPAPDAALLLDLPPAACLERVEARRLSDPSRSFEAGLTLERLQRMAERYAKAFELPAGVLGQRQIRVSLAPELSPQAAAGVLRDVLQGNQLLT